MHHATPGSSPSTALPPPPDADDTRTRERLLRAAVHVFDRKGYAAASVREIVERAGVTKPVLYYHFGNKEGLLVAVLNEGARRFAAAIGHAAERPGTTRERLMALGEALFALFQENLPAVRLAHSLFLGPTDGVPRFDFTTFDKALQGALRRIVEDGLAAGEVHPARPDDVALALSGVIGSCAARQLHPGFDPVRVDDLRRILDMVLDGILNTRHPLEYSRA